MLVMMRTAQRGEIMKDELMTRHGDTPSTAVSEDGDAPITAH